MIYQKLKKYKKMGFNKQQLEQIKYGLKDGLTDEQISIYANPEFDDGQMNEIRYGLSLGLDVSRYAKPEFKSDVMISIRIGLQKGLDVSKICENPNLTGYEHFVILANQENNIN